MTTTNTTIYVASAGTGKTTTLMDKLTTCLESTPPHKICFTTFTKAAAQEAIDRALIKNPELSEKDFTAFSTLHALCFRRIPRKQMLNYQDYKLLGELLGYSISGVATLFDYKSDSGNGKGDRLLQYESLMRNLQEPASSVLAAQVNTKFTPEELEEFSEFYRNFRQEKNKYDFTDQLEVFLESKIKLNVDYLFVDEAQDLSPLQWKIVDHISNEVKEVIIVGDDKQSIFKFAGGDPKSLIQKKGTRVVLDTSYRLPKNILDYAESVANRIEEKQDYTVKALEDNDQGLAVSVRSLDDLDFNNGTWFLLCRNKAMMPIFENYLIKRKILFVSGGSQSMFNQKQLFFIKMWEQLRRGYKFKASLIKELYRDYLPTGTAVARGAKTLIDTMPDDELFEKELLISDFGLKTLAKWDIVFRIPDTTKDILLQAESENKLDKAGDIEVNTIHSSKGREADNVVVLPDMTQTTYQQYSNDPDNEHRVFYVACTRAKKNLYLHYPVTQRFYPLP
mgnify:CR=1 FL=1